MEVVNGSRAVLEDGVKIPMRRLRVGAIFCMHTYKFRSCWIHWRVETRYDMYIYRCVDHARVIKDKLIYYDEMIYVTEIRHIS